MYECSTFHRVLDAHVLDTEYCLPLLRPTMASDKVKHLPLVYNPLLNCIFNNPHHAKSPLKSAIRELGRLHNDYAILVPPAHILQECYDLSSLKLSELCSTSEDFIKSHIIKTSTPLSVSSAPVTKVQLVLYSTMNGKQVLIKNGAVFTGRGSQKSMKLQILSINYFVSFCDYFPTGSRFLLIYIEDLLFGHQLLHPRLDSSKPPNPSISTLKTESQITFEELLRNFPVLSLAMADKFYILFHHNNRQFQKLRSRQKMPLKELRAEFGALVDEAFSIIQKCVNSDTADGDRTYNLLTSIALEHKSVDLNTIVHEYVELNIYDKLWLQLVFQYQHYEPEDVVAEDDEKPETILTPSLYRDLSCLSLNQLDVPVHEPWNLNVFYKRVSDAIDQFSQLANSTVSNQRNKVLLIRDTVRILTTGSIREDTSSRDIIVDADTLIGLLIMVVVHSKVPNLEAHLYYVKHFGASNSSHNDAPSTQNESGYLNYILSNIDAVIYHLSSSEKSGSTGHLLEMIEFSAQNYEFWYLIQKERIDSLEKVLEDTARKYGSADLPSSHFLRSKNIHGESFFAFAIRSKNAAIFKLLLDNTEPWILLEDILFDKNTTTKQNLIMIALQEEAHEIIQDLLDVLFANASHEELSLYLNSTDDNGRTVGHYLSHDLDALERVGRLIKWDLKDDNGITPLFSLCRCYDHPHYDKLIKKAFDAVYDQAKEPFLFENHIDKKGNTLLHVLAKSIPESQLLSKALIDINRPNSKFFFPAAVYVRYSRLENLQCLLADNRFIFDWEDPKNFYNLLDYCSFSAGKESNNINGAFKEIQHAVFREYFNENYPANNDINAGVLNARYDKATDDWIVNIVVRKIDSENRTRYFTKYVPMDTMRQFLQIQKLSVPLGFEVDGEDFWVNFPRGQCVLPICSKFRVNRVMEKLSSYFLSMNFTSSESKTLFMHNFSRCCQDNTLTLQMIKEVSQNQEAEVNSVSNTALSPQDIQEIQYFISFSCEELGRFQKTVRRLNKLISIGGIKQSDLRYVTERFLGSLPILQGEGAPVEGRQLDSTYHILQAHIQRLESGARELFASCEKVTAKLDHWKRLYNKVMDINSDLRRFESQIHGRGDPGGEHAYGENGENHGGQHYGEDANYSADHSGARRADGTERRGGGAPKPPAEPESTASSFFSFGFIETKNSRYKKLVYGKSEAVEELMALNGRIRVDHEAIAAAISQFLAFRSGLMAFAVKQFVRGNLKTLRHQHYEMRRTLAHLRGAQVYGLVPGRH